MNYRYERLISTLVCYITIDWNGSVVITDSTFPNLIGLTYPNLETFEKQYSDYRMNTSSTASLYHSPNIPNNPKLLPVPNSLANMFKEWHDLYDLEPEKINKIGCSHTFVPYVGIIETFDYCTKCDKKKVS